MEEVRLRLRAIELEGGNVARAAVTLGISRPTLQGTIATAKRMGIELPGLLPHGANAYTMAPQAPGRLQYDIADGVVLVGSDAHYWPELVSTAHRAFVEFCRRLDPVAVVMNGDVLDGATISRHPPLGWEKRPTLIEEIEAVQDRLAEIVEAAPDADKFWPAGNHCSRFETRIASIAPEYAKVKGVHLSDHFGEEWQKCWSVWINNTCVVKHRVRSGVHAAYANTLHAGMTIVTGHTHSLKGIYILDSPKPLSSAGLLVR